MTIQNHVVKVMPPAAMTSRRRPKRQRTPTTIYTDDNPRTFTTKKKKGESNDATSDVTPPAVSSVPSSGGSKKASPWPALMDEKPPSSSSRRSSSMPPPSSKRGPGRPPRKRLSLENEGKLKSHKKNGGRANSNSQQTPLSNSMKHDKVETSTQSATTTSSSPPSFTSIPMAMADATSSSESHPTAVVSLASESSSSITTTTTVVADKPTTPTPTKRKRGRPPKNRPLEGSRGMSSTMASRSCPTEFATSSTSQDDIMADVWKANDADNQDSIPARVNGDSINRPSTQRPPAAGNIMAAAAKASRRLTKGGAGKSTTTTNPSFLKSAASYTPPQEDCEGTFISHSVTVAPILPPIIVHDKNDHRRRGASNNDDIDDRDNDPANTTSSLSREEQEKLRIKLESRYPVVFEGGAPRACTSSWGPFASRDSQVAGTAGGMSSSSSLKYYQQNHQPQLPSWTPLYTPPVYFEEDYEESENGTGFPVLDVANTVPVTRKITALTVRKPHHDYLAVGDSAGFVIIYSLGQDNSNRPVARLESVACQQRGKIEQERLRADLLKRRKKSNNNTGSLSNNSKSTKAGLALFDTSATLNGNGNRPSTPTGPQHVRSILIDTSETTIHALAMIGDRVVLATSIELECMDVPSATSLWVCPLSSNRFVTSLDVHLNTYDVLVSCCKTNGSSTSSSTADSALNPTSPLMLLQHSKQNVEICDANSPILVRSPSCTAIWDVGCNSRLLFVALSANRQELELVLVSGGSIDTWKVACKTKIPTRNVGGGGGVGSSGNSSLTTTTKLSQSPGGAYTLVASSRGIRLYQTESLQLIHVYGDQLALHGQVVLWKDCWLAGSYFSQRKGCRKTRETSLWLECNDWLADSDRSDGTDDADQGAKTPLATPDLAPYIIGVPNVNKGPKELCEKLHIWKVEHPSVVPAMSIALPAKGEGALGLVGGGGRGDDRLVLVTNDGQGHMLVPKMESNFAGIMYPAGYQIITDNIEYIEDEDALDTAVAPLEIDGVDGGEDDDVNILGDDDDADEEMDEELMEAMRISLLEHKRHEVAKEAIRHDKDVDILVSDSEAETNYLPCRPEAFLRQEVNVTVEDDEEAYQDSPSSNDDRNGEASARATEVGPVSLKPPPTKIQSSGQKFVATILDNMPNVHKPIPLEEDCLSFTTTKVVVAVNPVVPPRQGRGKKSRPSNVEAMLKASINPYLQSMMISRQGCAVDGFGSRIGKVTSEELDTEKSEFGSNPNLSKQITESVEFSADAVDGQQTNHGGIGHFLTVGTSIPVFESDRNGQHFTGISNSAAKEGTPNPKSASADEAAVALGLLGLSPCNATFGASAVSTNTNTLPSLPAIGGRTEMMAPDACYESPYLNASSLSTWAAKVENSVIEAVQTPMHSMNQYNRSDSGGARTVESMSASSDRGSESEIGAGDDPRLKQHIVDKTCNACRGRHVIHTCGKRCLPIDYDEVANVERERREEQEEEKKRIRAEKRRLADQKRRDARKQKHLELEEQRSREEEEERLEKERQRQLQEDFASQDLNRQRREQIVASYAKFEAQVSIEMNSVDYNRQSETTTAPPGAFQQASIPQASNVKFKEPLRLKIGSDFEQVSRADLPASPSRQIAGLNRPTSAGQAAASYRKTAPATHEAVEYVSHDNNGHFASTSTTKAISRESIQSMPPRDAYTAATLASADALFALATFADATAKLSATPTPAPAAPSSTAAHDPSSSSILRYSYGIAPPAADSSSPFSSSVTMSTTTFAASHGFGAGVPTASTSPATSFAGEQSKRSIPSYAAIRGQSSTVQASSMASAPSEAPARASNVFGNGSIHHAAAAGGGGVESYVVWPPRRED